MATQTTVRLVDDLDGRPAEETIEFGIDGQQIEIDLAKRNAKKLRELFGPLVKAGRRSKGPNGALPARRGGGPARVDREQNQAIREWARSQGLKVSDRGRISAEVAEKFSAAH